MPQNVYGHFPDATPKMLDWGEQAKPMLKDGRIQQESWGFVVVICVDGRPNKRIVQDQAGDDLMQRLWHPDFIEEMYKAFSYVDQFGQEVVNYKAMSKWRFGWLTSYANAMAGGRFSQDCYSTYYTLEDHAKPLVGLYLTQHDTCAAASGKPEGTQLAWSVAIRAAVHDAWLTEANQWMDEGHQAGRSFPILTASVRTHGTALEHVRKALEFDWSSYDRLTHLCQSYQVMLPNDDCSEAAMTEVQALPRTERASRWVEEEQDRRIRARRAYVQGLS